MARTFSFGVPVEADSGGVGTGNRKESRFTKLHPEVQYHLAMWIWQFFLDSYVGGPQYVFGTRAVTEQGHRYLFRHSREEWSDYYDRIRRSYYLNYCKTIIDIYISTIYKKEVLRETSSESVQEFFADANGRGLSWDDMFREQVAVYSQVLGTVLVIVDMPRLEVSFASRAQEQASNIRPTASVLLPFDLIDFQVNAWDGELDWIIYREAGTRERRPLDPPRDGMDANNYKVWTRTDWKLYDGEGKLLDEGEHPLGRVPATVIVNERSPQFELCGDSAIKDIAFINREIYNVSSLRQDLMYKQTFPFLAWPMDPRNEGRIKIGSGNFVPYPPEGGPGRYISPDVAPSTELGFYREELQREIYRHAIVGGGELELKKQVSSGISKAFDDHSQNQNIVRKAHNLEQGERDALDVYWRWITGGQPSTPGDVIISYPTDYNMKTINDEIGEAVAAISLQPGPTAESKLKFRAIKSALPNLTEQESAVVLSEIEQGLEVQAEMREAALQARMDAFAGEEVEEIEEQE